MRCLGLQNNRLNEKIINADEITENRRKDIVKVLKHLCFRGKVPRGEVAGIVGKSVSGSRSTIRMMIEKNLVVSDGEKTPLKLHLSEDTAEACFPRLYSPSRFADEMPKN